MWYKPALAALVLGLCAACSDDDGNTTTPPGEGDGGEPGVVEPGTGTKTAGMYVLNTGNWGGNDATIQYFNLENLSISGDLFGPANGAGLGDLGQDLCLYGSKLYATVSGSSKLEVMDRNCKVIKTLHVTTDDDLMESAVDTASLFITRIPSSLPLMKAEHEVPSLPKYVARTLSSSVSFIALSAIAPGIMDFLSSSERIFLSILSQTSLWARIREKGGAYGAGAYLDYTERIMNFYSYRDPRLEATISDFLTSPESVNVSDENLEDAVIGILARDLRPMSPAVRSLVDIRRMLYRISDSDRERKKNEVLSLTKKDVEKGGEAIAENLRNGAYRIAVIGDRKALESSSLNWEMESLPG